jgi:MFS family permease
MKIASDYYQKGLGKSLGFLVGALVVGTAFPHLLKSMTANLPWRYVVFFTSGLSVLGGLAMVLLVKEGPFRKKGQRLKLGTFLTGFRNRNFRAAAFGYFGHMWELYTFWAFVPVMLSAYKSSDQVNLNVPFFSFLVIASGGIACFLSGVLSQYFGAKKIAAVSLSLSGLCCILSPLFLSGTPFFIFLLFLFFWGLVVVADSPLFSTLVAQNAPEQSRGTSLTIVNCIGFAITIVSIQILNLWFQNLNVRYIYMLLAIGPLLGVLALLRNKQD